jgi:DNA polymerase (family 10)
MDNLAIARVFSEVADLLEIKGENPFKIRAYRSAADVIAETPGRVAEMTDEQRRALPGIGRDLSARIKELADTGSLEYHRALLQEFPPTILDLLRLPGVGPKTVTMLHRALGIRSAEDLAQAAREGRLRGLRGMGAKKEQAILRALEERSSQAGRRLLAEAHGTAAALVAYLRTAAPQAAIEPVGSLRRGCETCGDLDILAAGAAPDLMEAFSRYHLVERVLGRGDTKSSVLLRGGFQADLRLVPEESRGAALQYFTGSKPHNIALRDRALQRGLKLNEYGLFRADDNTRLAGATEEELYRTLGLAYVPPELREQRGELAAAEAGTLPRLITEEDLKGDLHMHTTATDGRADIEAMARAAQAAGLEYIAITDHSQALTMARGLDERRALEHAGRIREVNAKLDGITVLAGIECDIRPDGTLDLADDCLAALDIVIASVHSAFGQETSQMTDRILRAIACPWVDVIGHPTGRLILRRTPARLDLERVAEAAARAGVALEINSLGDRLDLSDVNARLARQLGAPIVIGSDAHSPAALASRRWGVLVARRAWLTADDVLNTKAVGAFRAALRRNRPR